MREKRSQRSARRLPLVARERVQADDVSRPLKDLGANLAGKVRAYAALLRRAREGSSAVGSAKDVFELADDARRNAPLHVGDLSCADRDGEQDASPRDREEQPREQGHRDQKENDEPVQSDGSVARREARVQPGVGCNGREKAALGVRLPPMTERSVSSRRVTLRASDGHELEGYLCEPEGAPIGGLVLVQEIFGVNAHIRDQCEGYARDGFRVVAPAMFDRVERGVELEYNAAGMSRGVELIKPLSAETYLMDAGAAVEFMGALPTGIIGYCFGGSVAWRSAAALPVRAAVSYYGSNAVNLLDLAPKCPVMAHFGERDVMIPLEKVQVFRERHPEVEVHVYAADHGFNCDHRRQYDAASATLARSRSLAFLKQHVR